MTAPPAMPAPPAISPMRDLLIRIMADSALLDGRIAGKTMIVLHAADIAVLADIDRLLAEMERPKGKSTIPVPRGGQS